MRLQNVFLIPLWNLLPLSFSTLPPSLLSNSNITSERSKLFINSSTTTTLLPLPLPSPPLQNSTQQRILSKTILSHSRCTGAIVRVYQYNEITKTLMPHNCTIYHPIHCQSKNPTVGLKHTQICHKPKVLFFGAIHKSDSNRRFHLCEVMTKNVKDFNCFEGVFGVYLDDLIHHASIIALERYYEISSLESHRIDPLLLQGKILISTKSFGKSITIIIVNLIIFITIVACL